MKQTLLFSLLTFSFYSAAQMTQANEPAIGTLNTMYICDSFAVDYDGTTGSGVTWDYDNIVGYGGAQQDVQSVDPANTSYSSDFIGATYAIKIGSNLTTYYSSSATERRSQGFVYSEASLGDVVATFDTDDELVANYPFALGNSLTDAFAGNIGYLGAFTTAATGEAYATVDGMGTLMLAGNNLTNVLRYKIVDTSYATITFPINFGDVVFIRRQYEYYDYTVTNLPVLLHSTITIEQAGGSPISSQSLVLSYYAPQNNVGLNELSEANFSVYPNPANDMVNISGSFSDGAIIEILDQGGRVLKTSTEMNVSLSELSGGMYFVRVTDNGNSVSKRIVKQ